MNRTSSEREPTRLAGPCAPNQDAREQENDEAPSHGPLYQLAAEDHARLDALLRAATLDPDAIDLEAYARFRRGLLRHIAMEEKIIIPTVRRLRGGVSLAYAKRLRADHAALASLLVPTPTHPIAHMIRAILSEHNPLEEGELGLYAECERLAGPELHRVLARVQALPEVPVAPHVDGPRVHEHISHLLRARSTRACEPPR